MEGDGEAPVVLALPLAEARAALARSGWECAGVTVTAPPRRRQELLPDGEADPPAEEMLVVRQQPAGVRAVRLTVARHPGRPDA